MREDQVETEPGRRRRPGGAPCMPAESRPARDGPPPAARLKTPSRAEPSRAERVWSETSGGRAVLTCRRGTDQVRRPVNGLHRRRSGQSQDAGIVAGTPGFAKQQLKNPGARIGPSLFHRVEQGRWSNVGSAMVWRRDFVSVNRDTGLTESFLFLHVIFLSVFLPYTIISSSISSCHNCPFVHWLMAQSSCYPRGQILIK